MGEPWTDKTTDKASKRGVRSYERQSCKSSWKGRDSLHGADRYIAPDSSTGAHDEAVGSLVETNIFVVGLFLI
jgi:hypothetical protein